MGKNKIIILISILTIISAIILYITLKPNKISKNEFGKSSLISGEITDKYTKEGDFYIKILVFHSGLKEIDILIKDENVWNLIEKKRFYTVNIDEIKNTNSYLLDQIMINDDFKNIFEGMKN